MPPQVSSQAVGNKLSRLLIFYDGTLIGEYQHSQAAEALSPNYCTKRTFSGKLRLLAAAATVDQ